MFMIKDILKETLQLAIKALDSDNCNMNEEEMIEVIELMQNFNSELPMSKDQACSFLGISRSKFDTLVRNGKIPRGQKHRGLKELTWKNLIY